MKLVLLRRDDLSGKVLIAHSQSVIQDIKALLSRVLSGSRRNSKNLFEITEKVSRSLLSLLVMYGRLGRL